MEQMNLYKISELNRQKIWSKLESIEKSVSQAKNIVQNEMPISDDDLTDYYFEINDIADELTEVKHNISEAKNLYYTEFYDEDGEAIGHKFANEEAEMK